MVRIESVEKKSRAAKAGLLAGDMLEKINGREINDVLDYRFHLANENISLAVMRGNESLVFDIKKKEYRPLKYSESP